ncbi:MAG: PepSY-associated TM helix domain-containing protein [Candidatus Entotheonellia bacterium]
MTARKIVYYVHLALGLGAGGLIALIGLTGSAIVFGPEIDRLLNPHLLRVVPAGEPITLQAALTAVRKAYPDRDPLLIGVPASPDAPYVVRMQTKPDQEFFHQLFVFVNAYNGEILGARTRIGHVIGFLERLHIHLLIGPRLAGRGGWYLVGAGGLLLVLLCLTGPLLWWPGHRKLPLALTVKWGASWRRISFDLHRVAGIYPLLLLVVVAVTGAAFSFYEYVKPALTRVIDGQVAEEEPEPRSTVRTGAMPLPLDALVLRADQTLPGAATRSVLLPSQPDGAVLVVKRFPEEVGHYGRSYVWLDQYSGAALGVEDSRGAPLGVRVLDHWTLPVHTGEIAGLPGRILMCLAGLAPSVLFATGLVMWWNRRNAARRVRARRPQIETRNVAIRSP